jgi:hypothetical protein
MAALDVLEQLVEETRPSLHPGERRAVDALMRKRATYAQWGRVDDAQMIGKAVVIALHAMVAPQVPEPPTTLV